MFYYKKASTLLCFINDLYILDALDKIVFRLKTALFYKISLFSNSSKNRHIFCGKSMHF